MMEAEAVARWALQDGGLPLSDVREGLLICEVLRAAGLPADLASVLAARYLRGAPHAELARRAGRSLPAPGAALPPWVLDRAGAAIASKASDPPAVQALLARLDPVVVDRAKLTASFAPGEGVFKAIPRAGVPERIGPYRVVRELARGGMGVVFVARHEALGRDVAIKVILGANPRALRRFRTESVTTARLRHPNIVAVHEAGVHEGKPYLVMQLIDGSSLADRIARDGAFEPREAAALAETMARAVHYAHEQGVLHRDMKPANVLITSAGVPMITDFGLAKDLTSEGQKLTKTGQLLGTAAYMPPEQARGAYGDVGPASDVYSLGATLYEMITGLPPFQESGLMAVVVAVCQRRPEPPSSQREGIEQELDRIVLKCLEKAPKDRYASADELAEELAAFASAAPSDVSRARRMPVIAACVALALALALAAAWGDRAAPANTAIEPSIEGPIEGAAQTPPSATSGPDQRLSAALKSEDLNQRYAALAASLAETPSHLPTQEFERGLRPWLHRPAEVLPPPRFGPGPVLAYDVAHKVTLLFGGRGGWLGERLGDLWTWDGARWTQLEPVGLWPPARNGHALAYDAKRKVAVLFGGSLHGDPSASEVFADTWEWDGQRWRIGTFVGVGPVGRKGHTLVYDPDRERVLLFGGLGEDRVGLNDLWSWDGEAWTALTPRGSPPSPRAFHAMAYDERRAALVVHAGNSSYGKDLDDLWELKEGAWSKRSQEGDRPPAMRGQVLVSTPEGVLLFGGELGASFTGNRETYLWDGRRWTRRTPVASPPPLVAAGACWDAERQRVVVFGGRVLNRPRVRLCNDTWEYASTPGVGDRQADELGQVLATLGRAERRTKALAYAAAYPGDPRGAELLRGLEPWEEIRVEARPPGRRGIAEGFVYDRAREQALLFGGSQANGARCGDTWSWDGSSWAALSASGPPPRALHAMTYDVRRERVVLFGGLGAGGATLGDTWEWDGVRWENQSPLGLSPAPRARHTLVYDPERERTLLFGGDLGGAVADDLWSWDGAAWERLQTPFRPQGRAGHRGVFDTTRGLLLIHGGRSSSAHVFLDMWSWDGRRWEEQPRRIRWPQARSSHVFVWSGRRALLYGGAAAANRPLDDGWTWDGARWEKLFAATSPGLLAGAGACYDVDRGRAVIFGGTAGGATVSDRTFERREPR